MPTPVQTQLVDEVVARLGNISVANGYFYDAATVELSRTSVFQPSELNAIGVAVGADTLVEPRHSADRRDLAITVMFVAPQVAAEAHAKAAFRMAADITVALHRATGSPAVADPVSVRLGGLATAVRVDAVAPNPGTEQFPTSAVDVEIVVSYQVSRHDPFVLIP